MKKSVAVIFLLLLVFVSSASGADFEKIPIVKAKTQFLELYKTQWELFGIREKLDEIIDSTMDEQLEDLMWGTRAFQLAWYGDEIIPKIQEAAGFKFSPIYEKFVAELEDSWGDTLKKIILDYYQETSARLLFEIKDNPMVQAHLRQDYDYVTETQGSAIIKNIADGLSSKYNIGVSVTSIGLGLITVIGKQYITKKLAPLLLRKFASGAAGKLAGAAVPVAGWIMLAWGAWDMYDIATGTEDAVRQQLHDMNQSMYTREIPETYWEAMEPYVRDAFIFAYDQLQFAIDRGNELNNDPIVQELEKDLNRAEKSFFAARIAVLDDAFEEKNIDTTNLFKYFGKDIRDSSIKDFETIVLMLQKVNWDELKNLVDSIGMAECCKIFNSSPQELTEKFSGIQAAANSDTISKDKIDKTKKAQKEIPAAVTGLDKTKFLLKAKENFIKIFNSEWEARNMPEALQDSIERALEIHTRSMTFGTVGVQLGMNQDNVVDKIQSIIEKLFSISYTPFLEKVQEKWGDTLQIEILNFYKLANINLLVGENNPMRKANIRLDSDSTQENINKIFQKWLNEEFSAISYGGTSEQLYSVNELIYLKKLPEIFWSVIEPFASEAFIKATRN